MKISGIYKIESKLKPERIYIGSAMHVNNRWSMHLNLLRQDKHHSIKLQRHYNKYGISDLQFSVLLGCEKEDLLKTEQYFIDAYRPWFNIAPKAGSQFGIKRSDEFKEKLRKSHSGKSFTEEHKKKLSEAHIGRIFSEETKKKISESHKGKKMSDEFRERQRIIHTGMKMSEEHRRKTAEASRGRKHTEESKHKLSESHKGLRLGTKHSEETKRKIGEAHKGRKCTEESRQRMSEAAKKRIVSEETKQKFRNINLNMPKERKQKISDSLKRYYQSKKLKIA